MRPKEQSLAIFIFFKIECVMHLTRRVRLGDIKRCKIMEIRFNIRSLGNRESHISKNRDNFFRDLTDRVKAAFRQAGWLDRKSNIFCLPRQSRI